MAKMLLLLPVKKHMLKIPPCASAFHADISEVEGQVCNWRERSSNLRWSRRVSALIEENQCKCIVVLLIIIIIVQNNKTHSVPSSLPKPLSPSLARIEP